MSSRVRSQSIAFIYILCILAAGLTAFRVGAQTAAPPGPNAPPSPAPAGAAETTPGTGCSTIPTPTSAGGASVVQATGESLQHKSWQPTGGEIQFTVKSFVVIPPYASVLVCFRWKTLQESKKDPIEKCPTRLDLDSDGKLLKVTVTVPDDLGPQPSDTVMALPLVPLAEVRILARDNKKNKTVADVTASIGITHPAAAFVFAIGTAIIGFVALNVAAGWRLTHPGILNANWLLRIISTPSGYASLSQFQMLL
jgi:hypothetical protein